MDSKTGRIYEFGPFRLDAGRRLLLRGNELVSLGVKSVETLIVLIENKGDLVEKERLMARVWPDTIVEDSNLTHNISVLRKALGQGPDGKDYIETIPRRGYRFTGQVIQIDGNGIQLGLASSDSPPEETPQATSSQERIASSSKTVRNSEPHLPLVAHYWLLALGTVCGAAALLDVILHGSLTAHSLRDLVAAIVACVSFYLHVRRPQKSLTNTLSSVSQVAAFRGLLPFEPGDAGRFYGRDLEAAAISDMMAHDEFRFGVLYGDSGCGKTSLVHAGVLPRLEAAGYWVVVCRSYSDPLTTIVAACRKRSNVTPDRNESNITYLARAAEKSRSGLIIILDQFEEFYVNSRSKPDRTSFLKFLADCGKSSFSSPVKFLFTVRSDCLHFVISTFDEYLPDTLITARRYHLLQFDEAQAMEVIEKSVRKAQWQFDVGLSRQISQDLAINGAVLPSELQIIGEQLQNKRLFTLEQYKRAGGKEQLVHEYLEDVIKLTGDAETAQLILRCLISDEDTRLTLTMSEIQQRVQRSERVIARTIKLFVQMRLVQEIQQDIPWRYELIHEYLIEKINQATGKIMDATQRANRYFRQYLSNYAVDKKTRIPITRLWFIHRHSDLQRDEASRKLQRKSLWQGLLRIGAGAIILAVFVTSIAAWLSVTEGWDEVLLNDGHTAGVHRAVFSPDGHLLVSCGEDGKVIVWDFRRRLKLATLTGHVGWVNALVFAPDGKWFATGGYDHRVIVWNGATFTQEKALPDQGGLIGALGVSPDGKLLAVVTKSAQAVLWSTAAWQKLFTLPINREYGAVWFSADDRQLFVSGSGWWDLKTRHLAKTILVNGNWDAISPDNKTLASINPTGIVSFMDISQYRMTANIKVHQDNGRAVAYSPDGRFLATGADNIVLWDAVSRQKIVRLTYPSVVWALAFSPDGRYLVSTHGDGSILIWDPTEHELIANLGGHAAPVRAVAYSADGKHIASGGEDDSVIVWNAQLGKKEAVLLHHNDKVTGVAFSPDSQFLASADFSAVLSYEKVDAAGGNLKWMVNERSLGLGGVTYCMAMSPNGRWIATPNAVYSAQDGRAVALMVLDAWAMAFSPDGSFAVYAVDKDFVFWDSKTGEKTRRSSLTNSSIVAISFSPDGKLLATGEDEGAVRLWQVSPFREVAVLGRHAARVKSVVFSPDGREIASSGDDHVINLWSATRRRHITTIGIHASPVLSLAFSPDSKHLVSGEHDNSVRLYTRHRSLWGRQLD
jgi:WD40 repeat protein/DNA-binding winged helix-turn-helix (wHTH) protein